MSVEKFTLTEDHIKLIRQFNITDYKGKPSIDEKRLFGNEDVYSDIDLILNGKTRDINHDTGLVDDDDKYSQEQIDAWDKLLSELTTALDIVLFMGSFEPGNFAKRTYERNWIRKI
jgi:hypothetical protein